MAVSGAKAGIIGGIAIAVLGGTWVGAGIVGARQAEAQLRPIVDHPLGNGQWRLVNLRHQPGLVNATGSVEMRLDRALIGQNEDLVVARIDYATSHLPLPSGMARFHWTLKPVGQIADAMVKELGPDFMMQGDGRVAWSGVVESDMRLPEIALVKDGESVKVAPTKGTVVVNGNAVTLRWRLDRLDQKGQSESFSLEGAAVDVDLADFKEGTGSSSVTFDKASTTTGTIEGFKVLGEAVDHDDRRDIRFAASIAKMQAANYMAKDLTLEIAAKGLDRQNLKTLVALGNSFQPQVAPTADQLAAGRAAAAALMKKGFSLSVPQLAGSAVMVGDGKPQNASINAHVSIDLAPTTGAGISLASQLASKGMVTVAANGLFKEERQLALAQGVVTATPDGLKADYALTDGKLTLNGKPYDESAVVMLLAMAEQQVNHFLDPLAFPLAEAEQAVDVVDSTEGEPDETGVEVDSKDADRP